MPTIDRTILTDTDPQRVWDYLSDFTRTEEWDPPTKSTVRVSGDGTTGTVYRNVSSLLGKDVEIEYTVVTHEAPRLLQLRGTTSSAMEMLDTITVEPDGTGTTVSYRAEFSPQGATKLLTPLMPIGLEKIGDAAAERMHACLQGL